VWRRPATGLLGSLVSLLLGADLGGAGDQSELLVRGWQMKSCM